MRKSNIIRKLNKLNYFQKLSYLNSLHMKVKNHKEASLIYDLILRLKNGIDL